MGTAGFKDFILGCQIMSRHVRHLHIGHNNIKLIRIRFKAFKRFHWIIKGCDLIPQAVLNTPLETFR
jgi:hypothetical protein